MLHKGRLRENILARKNAEDRESKSFRGFMEKRQEIQGQKL